MAKLKDGFYKLTASSIGSDLHVLLAGGGSKPISDFALASDYVNLTGALTISGVKTFTTLLKFAVAKGTSPFTVTSSTLVANLNANYASELTSTYVSDPAKAYSTSTYVTWHTGGSTNFGSSGYMGNNYGFPVSNNANGILWLGTHSGPYGGLLGVSSNGRLYYRFITDNSFPTTANGGSWNRVAWVSDIPTKTSQLTNDSGFLTGTKYWANLEVGGSSNTSTTPTFGTFVRLNSSISEAGGDVYLEWWRGTNASWRILNNVGTLKFQCNYTSTTGSYYDAFKIDYNTGHSWIKGSLRVVGLLAGGYGATRAFYAGGGDTYVWIDSRDTSSNVKNNILLYDDRTSTKTLAPHSNNTYSLGTSSLRWSNIYSVLGNFRGLITSSVATGTSPFNVTSTTVNTNLNADLLDGVHLMGKGGTGGVLRSWARGTYTTVNQYFGNGNVVVFDPKPTDDDTLWPNTVLVSLGDASNRNRQIVFDYSSDTIKYRRTKDQLEVEFMPWRTIAFTDSNVASANKLATSRTISLTGSVTGSGSFDGSSNLSINTTTNHNHTCILSSGRLACEATTNRYSGLRLYEIYNNNYPFAYGNVIQFNGSNGVGQLACQWHGTGLAYRSAPDTSTTFTDWATIITSDNYSTLLNNTYLLQGNSSSYNNSKWLSFSNDSGGITGCMGVNDLWRIYGRSTATNAGYLEIATADDGSEPIYVRLYAQVFLNLKRTLTLLDGNGDTSIPGTLIVSKQVRATTTGGNWIDGQRYNYAALSITNSPDKDSYSPWIRLTLASGYWVSMGTISTELCFVGSSTSRTDNGCDIRFLMNFINGNFTILGSSYAAHFYENSDISLKKNIEIITDSDNIPQLKLFDWKEDGLHSYGFIAQELEELGYSELVSTKDDGYKTVNYSAALSLIVGKLQVKIKELENEIENLKKIKINTF